MMEWQISDQDIQAAEELLLPHGAHFPEDAREVIRCWHSTDVFSYDFSALLAWGIE